MRLEEWLKKNNITKAEFARKIGVSWQTIWHYLKGKRTPRIDIAVKIEEATGGEVRIRDLLKRTCEELKQS